eukprot:3653404-Amphidinium_carterae.1
MQHLGVRWGRGFRSALQHGAGKRTGDVDGDPSWEQEEGKAREQGPTRRQCVLGVVMANDAIGVINDVPKHET